MALKNRTHIFYSRTPSWRKLGEEPDYRFNLANERTFLAWIRNSLAILATGALFGQISITLDRNLLILVLSVVFFIVAIVLSLLALFRWRDNEIEMRFKRPLSHSWSLSLLAITVTLAGIAFIIRI